MEAGDVLTTGQEPATCHFLSLQPISEENTALNTCQLQFGKAGRVLPYSGIGKQMHDKPTTVNIQVDNHCYFCSIVYLLTGYQDQHFELRQSVCDYIADEKISNVYSHTSFLNMRVERII